MNNSTYIFILLDKFYCSRYFQKTFNTDIKETYDLSRILSPVEDRCACESLGSPSRALTLQAIHVWHQLLSVCDGLSLIVVAELYSRFIYGEHHANRSRIVGADFFVYRGQCRPASSAPFRHHVRHGLWSTEPTWWCPYLPLRTRRCHYRNDPLKVTAAA
jgi:hypothetical protein